MANQGSTQTIGGGNRLPGLEPPSDADERNEGDAGRLAGDDVAASIFELNQVVRVLLATDAGNLGRSGFL